MCERQLVTAANTKPEVSVVMSVYNGGQYLEGAVESILNQESVDLEFIIVNDGSTDNSQSILEQYGKRDSRIRLFTQGNQGLTKALIFGCSQAKADYVARQDADDISEKSRLRQQLDFFSTIPDLVMVSSWSRILGPHNEILSEIKRPADSDSATSALLRDRIGPPGHGSVCFSRRAYSEVGGYRPEFYFSQDSDLWLRLARIGKIAYIPSFLYGYRYTADGISGRLRPVQKEFGQLALASHHARANGLSENSYLETAEKLTQSILEDGYGRTVGRRSLARANYFIGSSLQKQMDKNAGYYFLEAVKSNPLHMRAWLRWMVCLLQIQKPSDQAG
ncbi:glycosyltransferase family 2 protein [Pseudomonadota bacterium]